MSETAKCAEIPCVVTAGIIDAPALFHMISPDRGSTFEAYRDKINNHGKQKLVKVYYLQTQKVISHWILNLLNSQVFIIDQQCVTLCYSLIAMTTYTMFMLEKIAWNISVDLTEEPLMKVAHSGEELQPIPSHQRTWKSFFLWYVNCIGRFRNWFILVANWFAIKLEIELAE